MSWEDLEPTLARAVQEGMASLERNYDAMRRDVDLWVPPALARELGVDPSGRRPSRLCGVDVKSDPGMGFGPDYAPFYAELRVRHGGPRYRIALPWRVGAHPDYGYDDYARGIKADKPATAKVNRVLLLC